MPPMSFATAMLILANCPAVLVDEMHFGQPSCDGDAITITWRDDAGDHIRTFQRQQAVCAGTVGVLTLCDEHGTLAIWPMLRAGPSAQAA